jgi:hypothetical protein
VDLARSDQLLDCCQAHTPTRSPAEVLRPGYRNGSDPANCPVPFSGAWPSASRRCRLHWRHYHARTSGRCPRVDLASVVGRITCDAGQLALGLLDDLDPGGGIVASALGHDLSQDLAASIDTDMELAPSSLSASAVLCSCPLAFPHYRKASAFEDQMDQLIGTHTLKVNVQASAASRQRRVVRGFEGQVHEAGQGTKEAFSLAQRQAEHEPRCQSRFDGQVGELLRGPVSARGLRSPRIDCSWRDPHGDVAALDEPAVVVGPVRDPKRVLYFRWTREFMLEPSDHEAQSMRSAR